MRNYYRIFNIKKSSKKKPKKKTSFAEYIEYGAVLDTSTRFSWHALRESVETSYDFL